MEIVDRIKKIVEREGISYRSFEANIGKSNGYVKQVLEKKGSLPSVDVILTIIDKYPDYSLMWLLTGEGEMIKGKRESEKTPPEEVRLEEIIAKRVLEELAPFIGQMTDRVIASVLEMSLTLDMIRSEQQDLNEKQRALNECQKKTFELIENKQ